MDATQITDAARRAMAVGSQDGERASMTLLKASSDLSQATMIHIFEEAQKDIVKTLARLKNKDLVTYHVEAALARVDKILDDLKAKSQKEARASIKANLISGKIISRQKSGEKDLVTAFDLQSADSDRVQILVDQMCGNIFTAADATKQSVHNQVMNACIRAQMSKDADQKMLAEVTFPTLDGQKKQVIIPGDEEKQISKAMQEKLDKNPIEAAKEIAHKAYEKIQFFKNRYVIGRREADVVRNQTLHAVAKGLASGNLVNAQKELITALMKNGLTAFTDNAGKKWTLGSYCNMAVRTTAKQSANLGELFDDPEHDLYIVVSNHSNCPICSKYEGRVYSRSGTNPNYPPLSKAFGKIDKNGPDDLTNTYLNIHPNCRHTLAKYVERAHSQKEIDEMRQKSNASFDIDPRTKAQVDAYKERERLKGLEQESIRRYREFMQYIPVKEMGSWVTFHPHYVNKDDWYLTLEKRYEEAEKAASK